jgi:hypothetical protein
MIIYTFHPTSSLHFTSLHFASLHINSPHFTKLHSLYFMSLHFWMFHHHASKTLHLSSLIITFLTLFLKMCDLKGKVASATAGSWFHSLVVLYTKEYLPMSVSRFLVLILWSCSSLLKQHGPSNLTPVDFHACSLVLCSEQDTNASYHVMLRQGFLSRIVCIMGRISIHIKS